MNPFDNAAEYIKKHGWCQEEFVTEQGRVCLWGAMMAGNGVEIFGEYTYEDIWDDLRARFDPILVSIIKEQYPDRDVKEMSCGLNPAQIEKDFSVLFNDYPGTTMDDVLTVLDKAGRKYDEQCG